jgi:hypothetical protein
MPLLRPRVARPDKAPVQGRIMVAESDKDSVLKAILGWIPVEVIAPYKFTMGFIPPGHGSARLWVTGLAVPVTFAWIVFATTPEGRKIAWRQAIIAPVAFACWAMAMQADVMKMLYPSWEPWMGSVALAAGTVLLPIFDGILKKAGVPQN